MSRWKQSADGQTILTTVASPKENAVEAIAVENGEEAKREVLERILKGSEVMTMTCVTLDTISLASEINQSGRFNSVRKKLSAMDKRTQPQQMNRLGAAPEFVVGSLDAVTKDGHLLVASMTGSQLPAHI